MSLRHFVRLLFPFQPIASFKKEVLLQVIKRSRIERKVLAHGKRNVVNELCRSLKMGSCCLWRRKTHPKLHIKNDDVRVWGLCLEYSVGVQRLFVKFCVACVLPYYGVSHIFRESVRTNIRRRSVLIGIELGNTKKMI